MVRGDMDALGTGSRVDQAVKLAAARGSHKNLVRGVTTLTALVTSAQLAGLSEGVCLQAEHSGGDRPV